MNQNAFRILGANDYDEPSAPKKKKGGILASFLPTIGGVVGGLAGIPLAPFTGGASILAGGALGSGLGEFGRQKVTGEDFNLGSLARETAFGAIPGVGKVAKGAKTALAASKTAKAAKEVRKGATGALGEGILDGIRPDQNARNTRLGSNILALENNQARSNVLQQSSRDMNIPEPLPLTPTPRTSATEILQPSPLTQQAVEEARPVNAMARTAERLFGRQTGIQPGAKVGSQELSAKRASELKDHVRKSIGSKPTDAADTILRRNESYIQNKITDLDTILLSKNKPIKAGEASQVIAKLKKPVGVDLPNNPTYKSIVADAANIKDLQGLEKYRRDIDEIINFSRSAASPDPVAERVALAARRSIDDYMSKKIPELKPIKRELSKAYDVKTFIQPAAAKPQGVNIPFTNLPIPGSARIRQSVAGLGSRGAEMLGAGGMTSSLPGQLAKGTLQQGGTRLAAAGILGTPLVGSGEPQATDQVPMNLENNSSPEMLQELQQPQMTEQEALPIAMQILAMQAAANGDTQQAQTFLAIAKQMGTEQKQNAEVVKAQTKASNANAIIDELEGVFTQAGGARGPIAGRATLLGAAGGGGNQSAKAYQEMRGAYTAQISRALGEVGVLTDKDREVIQQAIPSINDSEESKQIKIATLRNILGDLSSRKSNTQQDNSTEEDAIAALQQLGY